jgi:hypothetical protein
LTLILSEITNQTSRIFDCINTTDKSVLSDVHPQFWNVDHSPPNLLRAHIHRGVIKSKAESGIGRDIKEFTCDSNKAIEALPINEGMALGLISLS